MSTPDREKWIQDAYAELCRILGAPENAQEEHNLKEYARALGTGDDFGSNYFTDGYAPADAVAEDLSYAS